MPAYCTRCGGRRTDGTSYCPRCEARYDDDELRPVTPGPPGYGAGWFVGLSVVLALVVTGAIVGAGALLGRAMSPESYALPTYSDDSVPSEDPVIPTETFVPEVPSPTEESTFTEEPVPTEETTTTEAPIEPTVGNDVVAVAEGVGLNTDAAGAVKVLTAYFTAINNRDYADYRAVHTKAVRNKMTESEFTKGYGSTVDSEIMLVDLGTASDGRLLATVSFISHQDAADGLDGQTCTHWSVGKFLEPEGSNLRIGKASSGYANHEAC